MKGFTGLKEFELLKWSIQHDTGELDTDSSQMAKQYLMENVIDPLAEQRSLRLYDGTVIDEAWIEAQYPDMEPELRDRLLMAELVYHYARDYVLSPHPETAAMRTDPKGYMIDTLEGSTALPYMLKFPCESIYTKQGICWNQGITLATLYKLAGFDVALYLVPAQPPWEWGFYHACVLLRDEGWGLGTRHYEVDSMGNPMEGSWLLQDSMMMDPGFIARNPMMQKQAEQGKIKSLEFTEESAYTLPRGMHSIIAAGCGIIPLIDPIFIGSLD